MTGIIVMLPRDTVCYASTGCRLSLVSGKARAVIVPPDGADSHYKVLAGEILQVRGRPASLASGCDRAAAKLATLVRDGADVANQVVLQLSYPNSTALLLQRRITHLSGMSRHSRRRIITAYVGRKPPLDGVH